MRFKSLLSQRQILQLITILLGIVLIVEGEKYGSQNTSIIGTIFAIYSFVWFYSETAQRYKILTPGKKHQFDSGGEKNIADYFERKRVKYHLHPEIKINKFFRVGKMKFFRPFARQKLTPDFYLPEYDIFVEYWGMIDNKEYKEKSFRRKKEIYQANDIPVISLYPKNLDNLDFNFTTKLLEIIKEREGIRTE